MIADYIGSNDTEHHVTEYTLSTGIVNSYSCSYGKTERKQDKQSEPKE